MQVVPARSDWLAEQQGQEVHAVCPGGCTVNFCVKLVQGGLKLVNQALRERLREDGEGSCDDARGSCGKAGADVAGGPVPERELRADTGAHCTDVVDRYLRD